jgi:hypothetical protein
MSALVLAARFLTAPAPGAAEAAVTRSHGAAPVFRARTPISSRTPGRPLPLLLLAALQAAAPSPGVVEGVAVDSLSGAPVAQAKVLVRFTKPPPGATSLSSANASGPETVTAEDGRFRLEPPGGATFRLIVEHEGYTPFGGDRNLFGPDPEPHYTVAPGERRTGIVIRLDAECSLSGRVIDEKSGHPIAGIDVRAFRVSTASSGARDFAPAGGATSGPAGAFALKGLAPGEYQIYTLASPAVEVKLSAAPSEPSFGYLPQFYPSAPDRQSALSFPILPGARLEGFEIKLARERLSSVSGRIRLDGDPQPVVLYAIQPLFGGDGARHGRLASLPGPGDFVIRNLPRGWIKLSAMTQRAGGQPRRLALQRLDLQGEDVEDLDLHLLPGVPVAVEIHSHGLKDGRADPLWTRHKPSLRVELSPLDRTHSSEDQPRRVAETGRAEFSDVFFEPLAFNLSGLPQGWVLRELLYNGQAVSEVLPSLNPGAISHTFTALVGPVANAISGRVKEGDRSAPGAQVAVVREGTPEETIRRLRFRRVRADADGSYTLATLAPGRYRVAALPAEASPDRVARVLLASADEKVEVPETGAVRLNLSLAR